MANTMNEPKKWRDMTPEEKGALLLAHHEGKVIEWFQSRDSEWKAFDTPNWFPMTAYRVKPPEPRVWWLVLTRYGDVHTTCDTKESAKRWAAIDDTRSIVRVVECPDE